MQQRTLLQLFYLLSAILFVLGLRGLSHPRTARRGMFLAELGMLLAIVGTLFHHEILSYRWIVGGLVLGTVIGAPLALWIPMTAVPQRSAPSPRRWWASPSTPATGRSSAPAGWP